MSDPRPHAVPGSNNHRPEIDGLRAVAVSAVILFHAGVPCIAGGQLGVDLFFAISGFLITGIILRAGEAGQFSLAGFYLRRVRRIIPALVVMCLATVPFALWLMLPDDLENYGQSLVATTVSANNLLLWKTAGYFSMEAAFKPLIHTWSLGAEEQYYLLVPLALIAALKAGGRRAVALVLAVLSLASLGAAELLRTAAPDANFYLLPSRFWELGLGGLAAMARPALAGRLSVRARHIAVGASLAAIAGSLVLLGPDWNLPGWPSLVPVGATCIVLMLADRTGPGALLAMQPLTGLGLISYSLYLWHQPVFAFLRIASLNEPQLAVFLAAIPLVVLLAWLSWKFVEQPWRDPGRTSASRVLWFSGMASAALIAIGLALHATSGLRALRPELAQGDPLFGTKQNASYVEEPQAFANRPLDPAKRGRNLVVVGNSFARDFINMARENDALSGVTLSYAAVEPCAPWDAALRARLRAADALVIGSGVQLGGANCALAEIARARRLGVSHIVVLGTKGFGYNNNAVMLLPPERRYAYRAQQDRITRAADAAAARAIAPALYVSLVALLDDGSGSVPVFTPQRQFISQDRRHLTKAGARFVGARLLAQPQFAWLRAIQPSP